MAREPDQNKVSVPREAVTKLIAALDELNTAHPLAKQFAWRTVCLWSDILRPYVKAPKR